MILTITTLKRFSLQRARMLSTRGSEAKMFFGAATGTLGPAWPARIPLELTWARQARWDREGLHLSLLSDLLCFFLVLF